MVSSQLAILIVIVPLISALVVLIGGYLTEKSSYVLSIIGTTLTFVISIAILKHVITDGPLTYHLGNWSPPVGIEYAIDHLSAFLIFIITFIALAVVIFSKRSVEEELPHKITPFYSILLLLITGLIGIVATGDMFNLYVFLEVSSLTTYGLIGLGDEKAPLASFQYLIMGTIGASFYLLGVGFLYLITGSLNMADIATKLPAIYDSPIVLVAFAFLLIGICVKLALFPAHSWLPDAYTHAPSAVSAFIAATMTKVAAYMLFRIIYTVFKPTFSVDHLSLPTALAWFGVVAMLAGSFFAIQQTDLKRMLAYSSIAQIGYIVLGIGLANQWGITGGLLHIINHAFTKGCLFLVAGAIIYRFGVRDIRHFRGLYKEMPIAVGAFIVAAFSMIGIPPTGGFFSKLYLIMGAAAAKQWIFVAAILLSSLLNAVYFIAVIRTIYYGSEDKDLSVKQLSVQNERINVPLTMNGPILVTAIGIILLGIYNGWIIRNIIQHIIPVNFI